MLELPLLKWAFDHLGTLGGAAVLFLLLLLRFYQPFLQSLREKRQAASDKRREEKEWRERERDEMRREAAEARAELHKITTNHITHLEAEARATREFHAAAVEQLREQTHQLKEIRREHGEMAADLRILSGDIREIKGAVN